MVLRQLLAGLADKYGEKHIDYHALHTNTLHSNIMTLGLGWG